MIISGWYFVVIGDSATLPSCLLLLHEASGSIEPVRLRFSSRISLSKFLILIRQVGLDAMGRVNNQLNDINS